MSRPAPQPLVHALAGLLGAGEAVHLPVRGQLECRRTEPDHHGHGVDPPDVAARARERQVDRRHAEEHLPRGHQVDPEQVDERLQGALALTQQRVAPVLVREPRERVDPVPGQSHRPHEDDAEDQPAPDVVEPERPGRPPVDRQQWRQHAPPGVVEAGVVVGSAEPEDHQRREGVGDQAVQPEMRGVRAAPQPGSSDRDRDQVGDAHTHQRGALAHEQTVAKY